ncbi:uncharacterized protein TNCV_1592211 [Trichonephila clavipes]|nr:uncharacterized protein TNCV_1592211 [Trichonephila clavipes]
MLRSFLRLYRYLTAFSHSGIGKYTAGITKCNTQKYQRYHSEVYLDENRLYKDQTIKITASCDVWRRTKLAVRGAAIVGYNHFHTPRHKIKEALDVPAVPLGYSSPCGFPVLPKLIWCSSGECIQGESCEAWTTIHFRLAIDRENKQVKKAIQFYG